MLVHSSTQHPTEVQHVVAHVLGLRDNAVTVEVRRMGGGFGGKESQATQWAALAALAALEDRPALQDAARPRRRHDHDRQAARLPRRLLASASTRGRHAARRRRRRFAARCGYSADLSLGVVDRTMFHADNAYFCPPCRDRHAAHADQHRVQHRLPRLRRPAGHAVRRAHDRPDRLCASARDPLDVRKANFYGGAAATSRPTACGSRTTSSTSSSPSSNAPATIAPAAQEIAAFNADEPGPEAGHRADAGEVRHLLHAHPSQPGRRAGARLPRRLDQPEPRRHRDGAGALPQGGAGGGRGIRRRHRQGARSPRPRPPRCPTPRRPPPPPAPTSTAWRRSPPAARSRTGSPPSSRRSGTSAATASQFRDGQVLIGNQRHAASASSPTRPHIARVQLSSAGFYKTPKIHWDRAKASGRPFFYFAYGAACSEVTIDTLTGEMQRRPRRHPPRRRQVAQSGHRHRPDRGRLRAGHGLADHRGTGLRPAGPAAHPRAVDLQDPDRRRTCPADFRVALFESGGNREDTIYRSKAVGEPPLMLAISVFSAITDAIAQPQAGGRAAPRRAGDAGGDHARDPRHATEPTHDAGLVARPARRSSATAAPPW